jgi:tetratricopeptide (TPR) repeat protein
MAEENNNPLEPESDTSPTEPQGVRAAAGGSGAASGAVGLTPGQRLAAKKAQKAVHKREFKEELRAKEEATKQKEQEDADRIFGRSASEPGLPDNVQQAARTFSDFLHDHAPRLVAGVVGLLVLGGVWLGAQRLLSAGAADHAAALGAALELTTAPLDAEDTDGKTDDGKPVFKTAADRSQKALEAFAAVAKEGEEGAPAWALLAQAATEIELGKFDEARKHFQSSYDAHTGEPALAARALEGVGLSLEGAGKLDEAQATYEKLKSVEASKPLAEFHLARLKLSKGDQEGAKQMLKALYDELKSPAEGSLPSPYVKSEVDVRLAELDPTMASSANAPFVFDPSQFGNDPSKMSQEQIQRLLEQLKKGQGAPGAGGE